MNDVAVSGESTEKKYFTMLPNFIDDLDLSPYAFRLYVHLRRLAAGGSEIKSSVKRLAKSCKCSAGSIQNAKHELVSMSLITIKVYSNDRFVFHSIIVLDVWERNINSFAKKDHSRGERSYSPSERVHSPDERVHSPDERHHSPDERIEESNTEERTKKESKEEYSINTEFWKNELILDGFDENSINQKKIINLKHQVLSNENYFMPVIKRLKLTKLDFQELSEIYSSERFENPPESDDHLRKSFRLFLDNAKNLLKKQSDNSNYQKGNAKKFEKFVYPIN